MNKPNSIDALHEMLIEAAETERRLPAALPRYQGSYWPVRQPEWLSYADETTELTLGPATSEQVTRYDIIAKQLLNVPSVDDRRLLWAVAHAGAFRSRGPSWVKVGKYLHCDRRTAKRRYEGALINLWYAWN